jgi:MFS family permease
VTGLLLELKKTRFSRLLVLRWSSQGSDGLFQSGLASFLLFSPERAPSAIAVALGFAVVLLPYSLLGPFVGTILDRFNRRNVILLANIIRATALTVIATLIAAGAYEKVLLPLVLLSFGLSRLILAGLSAGLPRLVDSSVLVPANAIAVTGGTVASVIGGGSGFALRALTSNQSSNTSDAIIVGFAALCYLLAALSALRLRATEIGPEHHERNRSHGSSVMRVGIIDVRDGLFHLSQRRPAALAIARIALVRGGMTALIVTTILLQRNTFNSDPDAALADLALVVSLMGIGALLGATITPVATRRWSRKNWMLLNTGALTALAITFALAQFPVTVPLLMMLIAMSAQSIKVTADAETQLATDDDFRGRVFSVYDMSVNIAIVLGSLVAALLLPSSGSSSLVPLLVAMVWALSLIPALYSARARHHSRKS